MQWFILYLRRDILTHPWSLLLHTVFFLYKQLFIFLFCSWQLRVNWWVDSTIQSSLYKCLLLVPGVLKNSCQNQNKHISYFFQKFLLSKKKTEPKLNCLIPSRFVVWCKLFIMSQTESSLWSANQTVNNTGERYCPYLWKRSPENEKDMQPNITLEVSLCSIRNRKIAVALEIKKFILWHYGDVKL